MIFKLLLKNWLDKNSKICYNNSVRKSKMSRKKSIRRKEKVEDSTSQVEIVNEVLNNVVKGAKVETTAPLDAEALSLPAPETTAPPAAATETKPKEKPKTKVQKLAGAMFHEFMGKSMNVTKSIDNEHLTIIAYTFGEMFDDAGPISPSDIICYEITSKSNPNVTIFLDEEEISVMLNGKSIPATDDEIAFIFANAIGYIRKYYTVNAA